MSIPNHLLILSAGLLLFGSGCQNDSSLAQTLDQPSRPSVRPVVQDRPADEINERVRQASEALSSGDYDQAFEKSTRICELAPDNVAYLIFRGKICFAAGKMDECIAAYDNAIGLQPSLEPQLWQRGLALYYANRFEDGVKQFETHQKVNSQDVENAVWHLLCAARVSDVEKAREKLIPISRDSRVPMSEIYEMFAGRMTPEKVLETAEKTSGGVTSGSDQQKLQLYYAHLYTGLYQEMLNEPTASQAALKKAVEVNPLDKSNFMGQVARVHLLLRNSDQAEK